jgi:uncharacterized C2H2 Zn-finger protein
MPRIKCPQCGMQFSANFPPLLDGTRGLKVLEGGTVIICPSCENNFSYNIGVDYLLDHESKSVWLSLSVWTFIIGMIFGIY